MNEQVCLWVLNLRTIPKKNKTHKREGANILFISNNNFWTSLVVQWLRFQASNAGGRGSNPDWELRSHMSRGVAKTKQTPDNNFKNFYDWLLTISSIATMIMKHTLKLVLKSCLTSLHKHISHINSLN